MAPPTRTAAVRWGKQLGYMLSLGSRDPARQVIGRGEEGGREIQVGAEIEMHLREGEGGECEKRGAQAHQGEGQPAITPSVVDSEPSVMDPGPSTNEPWNPWGLGIAVSSQNPSHIGHFWRKLDLFLR
jgi:hypothetical protein